MSKVHIKMLSEDALSYLKKNSASVAKKVIDNATNGWIYSDFPQPMFVENEIELKIGNSKIINSKDLKEQHYKLLPNTDFIMNNTFWVGVYPALNKKDLDKTSLIMHKYFSNWQMKQKHLGYFHNG